jgi:hypothetical protein
MLSSPSLSRSIAVWKVNFQVRVVCDVTTRRTPSQVDSYLNETLPICEGSFPRPQGGKNPRNILYSPQLTLHYIRDVKVFGTRETLYGIVAGTYHRKGH